MNYRICRLALETIRWRSLPPLTKPVVHVDGMRVYATTLEIAALFRKHYAIPPQEMT